MTLGKRLETVAKYALALFAALALWRPGRKRGAGARIAAARRFLLVRIDDRVGEALLMTPLLASLKALPTSPQVDILVHQRAARVLDGHPWADRVIAFDRRLLALGALAPGIRQLRRAAYDAVINCANWEVPSVTAALVSRLAAPKSALIGPAVWPVGSLHDVAVRPKEGAAHELSQRLHLLSPVPSLVPRRALSFRAPRVEGDAAAYIDLARARPSVVVNPGGRLAWRRAPLAAFAEAAKAVKAGGRTPIVSWGPGEEPLARELVAAAPGAVLAPATDLDALAALMQAAGAVICNNTGPMHLSVAVGARTLAFFLRMDPARWGYGEPPHRMVDLTLYASSDEAMVAAAAQAAADFMKGLGVS